MVSSEVGMDNTHLRHHQPTLGWRGRMTGMLLARADEVDRMSAPAAKLVRSSR
jgi:hypothetical protein